MLEISQKKKNYIRDNKKKNYPNFKETYGYAKVQVYDIQQKNKFIYFNLKSQNKFKKSPNKKTKQKEAPCKGKRRGGGGECRDLQG